MTLQGKGFFIWKIKNCEGGNPNTIGMKALEAGLSHVLIKVANGIYSYNYDWRKKIDFVPPVLQALKARGIAVWGWHYVYGDNPVKEANKAIQRIQDLGLDGYVIDAEGHYKSYGKKKAAKIFMKRLKAGVPNTPLALSSYRFPSYHPQLPWNEFLSRVDYNMPQVYWMYADNPEEQLDRCVREFSAMPFTPPMIPTGAAFKEGGWSATADEVLEFFQAVRKYHLTATNFWEWYSCREKLPKDVWKTISDYDWESGFIPPSDITGKYIYALNTRNVNKVVELYTHNAVHVNTNRTIQGQALIRAWYSSFLNTVLPNATFLLTSFSGSGSTRHFTWTANSDRGTVTNGNDTFGLVNGKISYHFSFFTVTPKP